MIVCYTAVFSIVTQRSGWSVAWTRWLPLTQCLQSGRSYGKIEDCEQSTIMKVVGVMWSLWSGKSPQNSIDLGKLCNERSLNCVIFQGLCDFPQTVRLNRKKIFLRPINCEIWTPPCYNMIGGPAKRLRDQCCSFKATLSVCNCNKFTFILWCKFCSIF